MVLHRCEPGSNAYIVRPADDFGVSEIVNRVDIKLCKVGVFSYIYVDIKLENIKNNQYLCTKY